MNNRKYYKTSRAYDSLSKLPTFLSKSTESMLYKLINIPNIELDQVKYDITEGALNVVPSTTNLSMPPYIFEFTVPEGLPLNNPSLATEAINLHEFTFGDFTGTREEPASTYTKVSPGSHDFEEYNIGDTLGAIN